MLLSFLLFLPICYFYFMPPSLLKKMHTNATFPERMLDHHNTDT